MDENKTMIDKEQDEIDKQIDELETNLRGFDDRVMASAWQMKKMLRLFKLLNKKVKRMESNK